MSFINLFKRPKTVKGTAEAVGAQEIPLETLPLKFLQRNINDTIAQGVGATQTVIYEVPWEKELFIESIQLLCINFAAANRGTRISVMNYQNTQQAWPEGRWICDLYTAGNNFSQINVNFPTNIFVDQGLKLQLGRDNVAAQYCAWIIHGWEAAKRW